MDNWSILSLTIMHFINAISLTCSINDWLANTRHPRVLHIFDRACNLINERGEVLSVVTPDIGNGPFNLVLEDHLYISECLGLQSLITVSGNQLTLGDLTINTDNAKLWSPRPDWEKLHASRDYIINQLLQLPITKYQFYGLNTSLTTNVRNYSTTSLQSLISNLSRSLAVADLSSSLTATQKLAGLGAGLTPAGDDFIMGAMYAAWILHPLEIASVLTQEIADTAAPVTTSLSTAWLRSAGRGEAGALWHHFFDALISVNTDAVQLQIVKILSIGHTSGADALAGFIDSFTSWVEMLRTSS